MSRRRKTKQPMPELPYQPREALAMLWPFLARMQGMRVDPDYAIAIQACAEALGKKFTATPVTLPAARALYLLESMEP